MRIGQKMSFRSAIVNLYNRTNIFLICEGVDFFPQSYYFEGFFWYFINLDDRLYFKFVNLD